MNAIGRELPAGRFVDIHCHVLPELDDGPATAADADAMLRLAAAAGTSDIIATPHANSRFRFEPERVTAAIGEVAAASGGIPRIHPGCEVHLSAENVHEVLERPFRYTLNGRQYLLTELPEMFLSPVIDEILARLRALGLVPVVAHPERNRFLNAERVERWVDSGCLTQVTAGSLLGDFGSTAQGAAAGLLRRGLVHFVASDGHDTSSRPPVLGDAYHWVAAECGGETAEVLFMANPAAVIAGGEPVRPPRGTVSHPSVWHRLCAAWTSARSTAAGHRRVRSSGASRRAKLS